MTYDIPKITEQMAAQLAATLGNPDIPERLRIANDIKQAAHAAFGHELVPRPTRIVQELEVLLDSIRADDQLVPEIPEYLGPHLLAPEEYQIDELLENRELLIERLELVLPEHESSAELKQDRRGGRRRDNRIHHFMMSLIRIFEKYVNEAPKYTVDKETGNVISKWGQFADEAFHLFAPEEILIHEGKIRTAIQESAKFLRKTEPLDKAALDLMMPFEDLKKG